MARSKDAVIDDRMGKKKFEDVRIFVRDLFINGFHNRNGLNALAGNRKRAADESRQIIASILQDYYRFGKTNGERYLIAIDTRGNRHNPIHNIWKSKTFTGSDIILHFYILDFIRRSDHSAVYSTRDLIHDHIRPELAYDKDGNGRKYVKKDGSMISLFDTLTKSRINDKLVAMSELGLIQCRQHGRHLVYSLSPSFDIDPDLLDFASETMPVSTIGSYLIDRQEKSESVFTFRHNMISQVLDDEVMYKVFEAIREHREICIQLYNRRTKRYSELSVVPMFIIRNVMTGRQYLTCWSDSDHYFKPLRLDYIRIDRSNGLKMQYMGKVRDDFDELRAECRDLYKHVWGVNLFNTHLQPQKVSFVIEVEEDKNYVIRRLKREKRNGKVEKIGDGKYRFSIELYDSIEIIPWITSFYGYISELEMEDKKALEKLKRNFETLVNNHIGNNAQEEVVDLHEKSD